MGIRNIFKNLACIQDLLVGIGTEDQVRNSVVYTLNKIDVHFAVVTITEMQELDVAKYTRARVYHTVTEFTDYIYDPARLDGIVPTEGAGTWIFVSINSATTTELTALASLVNTVNKFAGKQVWDSVDERPVYAKGPLAADLWLYSDGATAQTPV